MGVGGWGWEMNYISAASLHKSNTYTSAQEKKYPGGFGDHIPYRFRGCFKQKPSEFKAFFLNHE